MTYGYPKPRRYSDPPQTVHTQENTEHIRWKFESQKITQNRPKHLNGLKNKNLTHLEGLGIYTPEN